MLSSERPTRGAQPAPSRFILAEEIELRRHIERVAAPLWMVLDSTPEGRGRDWYPKLDYGA